MTPQRILQVVSRILPRHFDREGVAHDLWFSAWRAAGQPDSDDVPCPFFIIRSRCIDAIRHKAVEETAVAYFGVVRKSVDATRVDDVEEIIRSANLTRLETQIVFHRFYLSKGIEVISKEMGITQEQVAQHLYNIVSRLRAAARMNRD